MQNYTNSPLVVYTKLSPNNSGKRTHDIDRITPHCVVGQCSVEVLGDIFAPTSRQASSNYGIGVDGRVAMYVEEKNRSWCSGGKDPKTGKPIYVNGVSGAMNDQRAITIECASDAASPYAFKEVVYNRLIDLCVDICQRYGKTKLLWIEDAKKSVAYEPKADEMVLSVHRWFANKSCPGDWMYARMDDLAAKVTSRLDGSVEPVEPVSAFPSVPFSVKVLIDDLNIRTSASMGNNLIGKHTGKGIFTITEVKDGWGKLKSGIGWIYLLNPSYVTIGSSVSSEQTQNPAKTVETQATDTADPEKIWNFLSAWIGNDYGVAGIMGNLYAESALVANNLQNSFEKSLGLTDAQYTAKVDDGSYTNFVHDSAGYGLAQWTYWSRKQAFLAYAESKKSSIGNLDMQLDFLKKEISECYASMLATLKTASSVLEASNVVLMTYEKPKDQGGAVQAKRAEFGQKFFDQFHKEQKADVMYYVQVGAFSKKENAEALLKKVQESGFPDAFIKQ